MPELIRLLTEYENTKIDHTEVFLPILESNAFVDIPGRVEVAKKVIERLLTPMQVMTIGAVIDAAKLYSAAKKLRDSDAYGGKHPLSLFEYSQIILRNFPHLLLRLDDINEDLIDVMNHVERCIDLSKRGRTYWAECQALATGMWIDENKGKEKKDYKQEVLQDALNELNILCLTMICERINATPDTVNQIEEELDTLRQKSRGYDDVLSAPTHQEVVEALNDANSFIKNMISDLEVAHSLVHEEMARAY